MAEEEIRFGEYMRRLRREAKRSLYEVSQQTGISYSHLSRIENDSTVPRPETIVRIAEALNGDLKLMLEKADCLPRVILDRIVAREEAGEPASLRRTAGSEETEVIGEYADADLIRLAMRHGIDAPEAESLAATIIELLNLPPTTRTAITALIQSLGQDEDADVEE